MTKREQQEKQWMLDSLICAGIESDDLQPLRRISMTLRRWFELECGTGTDTVSVSIERDEQTDKPFCRTQYMGAGNKWVDRKSPVADREKGALKRLDVFRAKYPQLVFYVQGDPRGCALYAVPVTSINEGEAVDSIYTRGIAIY
jgi:hypothetical protein